MGMLWPHCGHATYATIPVNGADPNEIIQELRTVYTSHPDYTVRDDKKTPKCNCSCWGHDLEANPDFVGHWKSPGCGWLDYQYWRVSGSNIEVFSRSSNLLPGCCCSPARTLCGCFICYTDSGQNQAHINQIHGELKNKAGDKLGAVNVVA